MKKIIKYLSTFLFAYLFWILFLMQDFNILNLGFQELGTGIVVSIIVSYFTARFFISEDGFFIFKKFRIFKLIAFIPFYIFELIKANIKVACIALSPKKKVRSGIVKVSSNLKSDWGLAMLGNCITLTPGTITIDMYDENKKTDMYIHWLEPTTEDEKKASEIIKGNFEKKIGGIFE